MVIPDRLTRGAISGIGMGPTNSHHPLPNSAQFKKGDIFFNYGCFPQTWEEPTHVHPDAKGSRGDNDPLDVVEIGARIVKPGVRTELLSATV